MNKIMDDDTQALPDYDLLIQANTHFALNVMRALGDNRNDNENIFFCPYNLSASLSMLSIGAR